MFELHEEPRELLTDQVYRSVRNAIIDGQLLNGCRLKEKKLAETLGVSRTPVREALNRLQKEGLVIRHKSGGLTAKTITIQDVIEIIELRQVLETFALRLIKRRFEIIDFNELIEIQQKSELALHNNDVDSLVNYDAEFHRWLVWSSGNIKLYETTSYIGNLISIGIQLKCFNLEECAKSVQEHAQILKFVVLENDFDTAERCLLDHLEVAKNLIIKRFTPAFDNKYIHGQWR